jgi:heme/copper-type cytochrome/quinol oxidase subunit 2
MKVPTLEEAYAIAPNVMQLTEYTRSLLVTLVLIIIVFGFVAGYRSRNDHVETLKAWIDSLKGKK